MNRKKNYNNHGKLSTEEKDFIRNTQHMAFTERDVLFLGKDCKYTAALVFCSYDDDNFYLVQDAVW